MKFELSIKLNKKDVLKITALSVAELMEAFSKLGPLKKKLSSEFPVKRKKPAKLRPEVAEIKKLASKAGYCEKHEVYFEKKLGCSKCEFEKRSGKKASKLVVGAGGVPSSWKEILPL